MSPFHSQNLITIWPTAKKAIFTTFDMCHVGRGALFQCPQVNLVAYGPKE